MYRKFVAAVVSIIILSSVILSACAPSTPQVVEVTKMVEKTIEVAEPVEVEVEKIIEATAAPQYSDYTVILVVDDFGNTNFPQKTLEEGDLCVVALHEQWVFKGAGACVGSCAIPHGLLVYEEIESRIGDFYTETALERLAPIDGAWGGMEMDMWETPEGNILLVPVDTQDFETNLIAGRIADVVDGLAHNPPAQLAPLTRGVVLNASFAFVPCEEIDNAEGYLQQLKTEASTFQDLLNLAYSDTLYFIMIGEKQLSVPIVTVAAAGNESADFPYAPAILDGIVSVSALPVSHNCAQLPCDPAEQSCGDLISRCQNPRDPSVAWYSNYGEVALDGNHSEAKMTLADNTEEYISGTSFAAPKMSFWVARYLLRKTDAEVRDLKNYCSLLYPSYGTWGNWELGSVDAVNACPDFP